MVDSEGLFFSFLFEWLQQILPMVSLLVKVSRITLFLATPPPQVPEMSGEPQLYDGSNCALIHGRSVCHKDIFFYEFQSKKKAKLYQHRPQIAYHLHATSPGYYGSRELEDKHPKFPTIIPVPETCSEPILPSFWGQIDEKGAECWCTDSVVPIDLVSWLEKMSGWWFETFFFIFIPIWGMIQLDWYFSDWLKPPTGWWRVVAGRKLTPPKKWDMRAKCEKPPKMNIAPENRTLESRRFLLETIIFRVQPFVFWGCRFNR